MSLDVFVCYRELEGLVFQCGLDLGELREQVEQMQQEELTSEVSVSQCPQHTSSPAASKGGESQTHLQVQLSVKHPDLRLHFMFEN